LFGDLIADGKQLIDRIAQEPELHVLDPLVAIPRQEEEPPNERGPEDLAAR